MAAAGAFLAGAAFGGIRYGYLKFHLYERESVVHYSADSVKAHFLGEKKLTRNDVLYVPVRSREHEYYTYVRTAWNSKVLAFRDSVVGFFDETK